MDGKVSTQNLINIIYDVFAAIPDRVNKLCRDIKLVDSLMSGYALFSLKCPSLLQFDIGFRKDLEKHNLKTLFKVEHVPSDTYMREVLDEVDPQKYLRKVFNKLWANFQRGKFLKLLEFFGGRYLMPLDGTGYFYSDKVHCEHCCEKHHKDGSVSYYHQMLGAAMVHPDYKIALPFAPEPIMKSDGAKKNDCERRAAGRFLDAFKREHPHMKMIVTGDSLFSNGPFIKRLKSDAHQFILVAKELDHKYLFDEFRALAKDEYETSQQGTKHRFKFMNGLPLNDSHPDCIVNVLEYWEETKNKTQHWVWVTDIPLSKETVFQVMKGGRARCKIENETFNTLKNQGYHFEHNFGHGKNHLSTVFAYLMNIAFFVDQLRQLCCKKFKKALARLGSKKALWEMQRTLFFGYYIDDWETLMNALADGHKGAKLEFNSS